ncbi:ABC transporter permease/M1 family aminopeptidase [Dyadobacter diqingensis]|uniref:ABC transporter permease/M1 family aminopeptidase n=1 Tax=Dyadobacter diqingensis TaxID=2938121 RepID=UPI0020C1975A|nr:M1 family aminopeptidase [Dyadobacter diqingensis]
MLSSMLGFEIRYHFSQITFKLSAMLFFMLGVIAIHGSFGGDEVHKNAPYVITFIVGLLSLSSIFVSTLFCANVVLRDATSRMEAIVFATSVKRGTYFLVRFLGLLISVFIVLFLSELGVFVGSAFLDAGQTGTFSFGFYLQPLLVFGLPNILFSAGIIFCTAMLTRNLRAVYAAGVLLYILYLTASILGNSPLFASSTLKITPDDALPILLDPFGLAAFFTETRTWTDLQRNTLLFPLTNPFLSNRLLWTTLSLFLLGGSYRFFSFRPLASASAKPSKKAEKYIPRRLGYQRYTVQPAGTGYFFTAFRSQLKLEVIGLYKHIPFMVMLLLWIFIFTIELKDTLFSGPLGIRSFPATSIIVDEMRSIKPALLLIIFYTAELLGRERTDHIEPLIYSTPVPNGIIWAAKSVTLAFLLFVLVTANIGIGLTMQIGSGYFNFELSQYLSLYYYSGLPLLLFALLAILIQTLTPNKYLGMLLTAVVVFILLFSKKLGLEHYLLRYGIVPELHYADMNGFGHYAKAFNWYMLYWTAFSVMLSLLAIVCWRNNAYIRPWQRIRSIGTHWTRAGKTAFILALITWMSTGAYIYYQTNIAARYKNSKAKLDWKLQYEKKYKPLARLAQPNIKSVKTTVDLYPDEARYTVKGHYILKNETAQPMENIVAGVDPEITKAHLMIHGVVKSTVDAEFGQYSFQLTKPLMPGQEIAIDFSLEINRSGFTEFNNENSVATNGSYIELEKYVPFLGYNSGFETDDPTSRKNAGLPTFTAAQSDDLDYHLIDFETTVSTLPDQYVLTTGTLKKSWTKDNRRFFNYKTSAPVNFMFALSSARYETKKEKFAEVELRILHQKGHENNVPFMMKAMKDALNYCNLNYGQYPLKQLTIAEIPHYRGAATAYPGIVFSAEKINFLSDFRDTNRVNQAYAIVAHEVSHQWWANRLAPADQPGRNMLTESLAKYTEMMILEKTFGKSLARQYLKIDNSLYFAMRNSSGKELPLTRTLEQTFVHYQKGGLVMYAIRELLGETRFNAALHDLLDRHSYPHPKATADDLLGALYRQSTTDQAKLTEDWLTKVIVYDLQLKILSCKPLTNGQFRVKIQVDINKTDQLKNETIRPDEYIDIAVYDRKSSSENNKSSPVYLQKHHFNSQRTVLDLTVNKKPGSVVIDPMGYLLDENQSDHLQLVR